MSWLSKIVGAILGGDDFSVGTGSDADATAAKVNGALAFKAVTAGGPFGSGYASICYRVTGETWADPAFVYRANGQLWEGSDLTWHGMLNGNGLGIGIHVSDAMPYVRDRLDVRRGNLRVHNDTDNYSRLESGTGDTYLLLSKGAPNAADPLWAIGRGTNLVSGHGDDLIIAKFKNGTWSYVATLGTY